MMEPEEDQPEPSYKDIISQLSEPFVDEGFPPDQRSIFTGESVFAVQPEEAEVLQGLEYSRLSEIHSGRKNQLLRNIRPDDIVQGCLCNSYFLSAISALAETPDRLEKCFVSSAINEYGCYAVELYLNGEKTEIIIDDHIPVYKDTKDIAFSTTSSSEVWVHLLEKAWAKANGGYDKIVFGLSGEVLRAITGAPTFIYDHEANKKEDIWRQVKKGVAAGYTMLCSLDTETYNYENEDFVSNFSYNIIGAYKVNTNKGDVKLVKMRNPWGNFEWEGDWSDTSRLWTADIKEEVEWESSTNGIFYMSLEDYYDNFMSTVICKIMDDNQYSTCEVKQDIGANTILKFALNESQKAFFSLSQLAYRIVPREYGYRPYNAKMILARLDKENKDFPLEFIDATVDEKDEISIEADLIGGEYYLFWEVDWNESRPHDSFVVSCYGSQSITMSEKKYPSFLEKALSSWAMLKSQRAYYYDHSQQNSFRCMSVKDSMWEYGFLFYYNHSTDAVLEEKINFSKLENLELMEPYSGTSAKIKVSAGKSKIILLRRLDRYCKFDVEYKTRFSFGEKKYLEEIYDKGK